MSDERSLYDRWVHKLKSHPVIAALILGASVVGGVATFGESAGKLLGIGKSPVAASGPCSGASASATASGGSVVIQCTEAKDIDVQAGAK